MRVFTIGHSTHTLEELVTMLRAFGITLLADIRTVPRSRHNPQFNGDSLSSALRSRGLRYAHLPELGGLRRARKDSENLGWHNASFRGFADYMLTDDFEIGMEKLRGLTAKGVVALMCAEAVPWRCHRSLVADALTARRANVEHITGVSRSFPHKLTSFAQVRGTKVTYPAEDAITGRLTVHAPFHLEATVRVLQRRPTNTVEVWDQDRYVRVLETADGLVLVDVENCATIDEPDLRFTIRSGSASSASRTLIDETLRQSLGLDVNPEPLQRLATAERRLRPTAVALRGMRPPRFAGLFEAFANVVPFQQLSLDAGVAIVGRIVERFGTHIDHDGRRFHGFPPASRVADARLDRLRDCGLSLKKAECLRHLARSISSGELTKDQIEGLSTLEALRVLAELPGIGLWSASVVLLRGFGRLEVFPPGDVGVARGLGALMHLEPGAKLGRIIERFGDRRGYLYFCALGGSLLAKGFIRAAPSLP